MRTIGKLAVLAAVSAAFAAGSVQAHAIWFAQRSKHLALIYGTGADDLDAVKRQSMFTAIAGYGADWKPVPTKLEASGPLLLVGSESPAPVVTAVMDNGLWSKTPDGEWHHKGKDEVPDAVIAERNWKFAVHIDGPITLPMPIFADQIVQIVPLEAIPDKMGKKLKLRVLFHGKPAAGAPVIADMVTDPDATPVKTDAAGEAVITIRNQGLNVVNAVYYGDSTEPEKTKRTEYEATLSFALGHEPE